MSSGARAGALVFGSMSARVQTEPIKIEKHYSHCYDNTGMGFQIGLGPNFCRPNRSCDFLSHEK